MEINHFFAGQIPFWFIIKLNPPFWDTHKDWPQTWSIYRMCHHYLQTHPKIDVFSVEFSPLYGGPPWSSVGCSVSWPDGAGWSWTNGSCPPFVWDMTGTSPTKGVFLADFLTLCGFGDQVMGYQWNFWSVLGSMSIPKCGSSAHDSCGGLKCGERSTALCVLTSNFPGPPCRFWAILCVSPERLYLLLRSVAIDGSWHTKNNLGHRGMFFGAALWHWKWNVPANRWFSVEKLGTQPGLDAESGIRQCPSASTWISLILKASQG